MPQDNFIVGLDIGTTKVCAIIAEKNEEGEVEIMGVGEHPSDGLQQGVVTNVDDTVKAISAAIDEAEMMAGRSVTGVYVGIAGGHIESHNSKGVIAVNNNGTREITAQDVDRVIDAATSVTVPPDPSRELIHVIPQEFFVDGQDGIIDPVGMTGVRLEAKVHAVTASVSSAQNLIKSVHTAGYDVEDIVLEPLASSYSVLDPDEKELGACLVDIGGGTSDMAIFKNGAIFDTDVISVGGEHVTNDVMKGLRMAKEDAEMVKINHGCSISSMAPEDERIEIPSVGGRDPREIKRRELCDIVEARMEEIFQIIDYRIKQSGYGEDITAGMVVTGGASGMPAVPELAEDIVDMPVRLGEPWGVSGLIDVVNNPKYATAVGLVLYGFEHVEEASAFGAGRGLDEGFFNQLSSRMGRWFEDMGGILSG